MIENESGEQLALDNSITTEVAENEVSTEENNQEQTEAEATPDEQSEKETTEGEVKKKRPSGFHRKISRLEQENANLQAKLEALSKAKHGSSERPVIDNFETYDQYTEALTDWKIEQKESERESRRAKAEEENKRTAAEQSWQERLDSLPEQYEDYELVVGRAFNSVRLDPVVIEAAREAGPEVIYHIAKDVDLVEEFSRMSPAKAMREILKVEAELSRASKPQVKVSKSSPPITPVKGLAKTSVDLGSLDTDTYIAQRYGHLLRK